MPCLSGSYDPEIGPIIELGVGRPLVELRQEDDSPTQTFVSVRALIDSGSASTCVTAQIARRAGVLASGKSWMDGTTGRRQCNYYILDLQLPTFGHHGQKAPIPLRNVQVVEIAPMSPHFEALLGRDVLDRGLFSLSGHDRRFVFCL